MPATHGRPVPLQENPFIEAVNGRLLDECLNVHQFTSMAEAQHILEAWRLDYNQHRPHGTIGDVTPMEFIQHHQDWSTAA